MSQSPAPGGRYKDQDHVEVVGLGQSLGRIAPVEVGLSETPGAALADAGDARRASVGEPKAGS